MVVFKPAKGIKIAGKLGGNARSAGKSKLDDLARKGKKAACACPRVKTNIKNTRGTGKELIREIEAGGHRNLDMVIIVFTQQGVENL
jgi:hypothetical protein